VPEEADELAAAVFEPADDENNPSAFRRRMTELAGTGADVVPLLRTLHGNADTPQWVRVSAAGLLHDLGLGGLDELRRLAAEEHLSPSNRCTALIEVARRDPTEAEAVRAYFEAVAVDARELLDERAFAAHLAAHFRSEHVPAALALLRAGATDRSATSFERTVCVERLRDLFVSEGIEIERLAVELLAHPGARQQPRRLVIMLDRQRRTEVERDLLADRSLRITARVPRFDLWDDLPLAAEAEAVIREVLGGPETSVGERVDAAVTLARLGGRFVPEATRVLAGMGTHEARKALARLGAAQWRQVVAEAEREVSDASVPVRERVERALVVAEIARVVPESVARFLREALAGVYDLLRLRIRFALRKTDGLGPVRAMRDDARSPSAVRWQAAIKLVPYDVADRTAAVALLHAIATDPTEKPALRRRVTYDLAYLGTPGREKASAVLRAMAVAEDVPVAIRIRAARGLVDSAPAHRRDAVELLRRFRATANPLLRLRALQGIGQLEPVEAAVELAAMAADRRLLGNVRLRCAVSVMDLWQPLREKAVMAVREVAGDASVARHVRWWAARVLARWSEMCREEARELIRELNVRGDDDRCDRDPSQ
jgi:hypothetical protein